MTDPFERIVVPVADPDDAAATARALAAYEVGSVLAVHVVEKGGGSIDKASVEQREEYAAEVFEAFRDALPDGTGADTRIAYGTDVPETTFEVADEIDATAIAFSPRSGNRWLRLLTGDVAFSLVTESDRPVVVLPDPPEPDEPAVDGETGSDDGDAGGSEPET